MASTKKPNAGSARNDPFALLDGAKLEKAKSAHVHVFGNGFKCRTESRGYATPQNKNIFEIVVDASEGFIPLWAKGTTLRWRFQEASLAQFANPNAAKTQIRKLLANALLAWGDAVPIKFTEKSDNWDFEIAVKEADDCEAIAPLGDGADVVASVPLPL